MAVLSTKMDICDKETFDATAEALGMSSATALKVFVKKFNECGGFPFEVRQTPAAAKKPELSLFDLENAIRTNESGETVLPKEWNNPGEKAQMKGVLAQYAAKYNPDVTSEAWAETAVRKHETSRRSYNLDVSHLII